MATFRSPPPVLPPTSGVLLLVEDDPDDEALTLSALGRSRVSSPIVVVRDGHEALDYFFGTGVHQGRDARRVPTVTLMDIKLPGLDGLEVLRRVRADPRTRLAPVVVLTTSTEHRDIVESYGRGANGFVRKPVDFEEFSRAIDALGVYWLVVNRPPPPL